MPTYLADPPLQTPLINGPMDPTVTRVWYRWLLSLMQRTQAAAWAVATASLTAQTASVAPTNLLPVASGLYRVGYAFRVTTAAGTSSSLLVTIGATDGGVACSQASAAYTGNATNAPQSGSFVVRCDPATALTYSTTYASVGAPAMAYSLDLTLEAL